MPQQSRRTTHRPWIERVYRALIRLLPFEFRAEYGRDMEQTFADERDEVRSRRNFAETLRFWLRTAMDFVRTAPRQHWDLLKQDARVGIRQLTRHPGFAATAILTLALGIGGSTSIFSVVYAVVLRPLPFPDSARVVNIGRTAERDKAPRTLGPASLRDLVALREHSTAFEAIGVMRYDFLSSEKGSLDVPLPQTTNVGGVGQSFVPAQMMSASLFKVFGASTVLGRLPDQQDEQPDATPVAVLSYGTWTSTFGRDPDVIGRSLVRHLGGGRKKSVTVIGVLAPDAFEYPSRSSQTVPAWASIDPELMRDDQGRETYDLAICARLAAGVSLDTARAQVAALTPHLASNLPPSLASGKPSLEIVPLRDRIVGNVKTPMLSFLVAVSCLLLIACVNVASLVLARAISRRQEFAARFALGARPLRVARQLLTESAMIALAGGVLGLALAWAGRRAFVGISPSMPRLEDSSIGVAALAFALIGSMIATCIAGVMPAVLASRRSVVEGLRLAGGTPGTATAFWKPLSALAAAEIAIVLFLLAGTGLLVNSFARLVQFDLGFDSRSMVMFTIERNVKPAAAVAAGQTQSEQTVVALSDRQRRLLAIDDEVVRRVSATPGVIAAALTGDDPFGPPYRYGADIQLGDARSSATVALRIASPSALNALRMQLVGGRWFTSDDRDGTPFVAVVNQTMAQRLWSDRSPIGDLIVYGRRSLHVVGIVTDVRDRGAREEVRPTVYLSTTQLLPEPVMLVVRTMPGLTGVENVVLAELARMGGDMTLHSPRRPEDIWWRQLADARFLTLVISVFSVVALSIALAGVQGVLRSLVAQRTREMGIRKALGATGPDLVGLVLGQALRFTLVGCLIGLIAAAWAGPAIRTLLFGITPTDPLTLGAVTLTLIGAIVVGAYFPARRASAVDPALSLRSE